MTALKFIDGSFVDKFMTLDLTLCVALLEMSFYKTKQYVVCCSSILSLVQFLFSCFFFMLMCDNEYETKENKN